MVEGQRKGSLLAIFLTVFIDLLGFGMVLPLLPIYADHFTVDEAGWQLGLLMASFSAMQFFFAPLWGRLSDRIGRRPVILIGLASSVICYTLFGVATVMKSMTWLFVSRIGAGIAGATVPTAQAYIADTTSLEERPKGMALIGMAFGLGFTFGPLLGFLAVPDRHAQPGPWPGYVAAILSATAWVIAWWHLPESKQRTVGERHVLDVRALREAMVVPSIAMLLFAVFVCMFSFAKFETTLSLLIKGERERGIGPFDFSWGQVCLTYAFIGVTLAVMQGGVVRRLANTIKEGWLAGGGALLEVVGYSAVIWAIQVKSVTWLFVALAIVVTGYAFMQPNLNSLISRRSDPRKQGMILGVGQSVNSLARIIGSAVGIPLLRVHLELPYWVASALMLAGLIIILIAARSGSDYATSDHGVDEA